MEEPRYIVGKTLIDGTGREPMPDPIIAIENGIISQVFSRDTFDFPPGAAVLDASDLTIMPGMMDLHVHMGSPNALYYKDCDTPRLLRSSHEILVYAVRYAQLLLEAGFTTVRDLDLVTPQGLAHEGIIALKDAINNDVLKGPRIVVGGMTFITGSHFELVGWLKHMPRPPGYSADGPDEFRKLSRKHIRQGCDVLKTCISGGTSTFVDEDPNTRHITQEELNVMVEEAHAFNKKAAAHCHTPEAILMALQADVDTIEHCVFTNEEATDKMVASGKYMVPTLAFRQPKVIEARKARGLPPFIIDRMMRYLDESHKSFQRFHEAGVKFAMGTDTHVDPPFGENAVELEVYVKLGLSPMEAILTATRNAADALGKADTLGTVEAGKFADMLAIAGDPLEDISVLQDREKIAYVLKGGKIMVDRYGSSTPRE